jgi:CDP-4-dehydro-6-deoxyglucose reductase
MLPQWQKGVVKRMEQATPNTSRYWIELPETAQFGYKPGQFVTLDLPIHPQRNKRWRSYSIAAGPQGGNVIELVIVHLEQGLGSKYMLTDVCIGSVLTLRGPQGVFVLPENLDKDLFFICTGTGIAPFRAMLHQIKQQGIPHGNIHLIFGTRTQQDLLYAEEMKALEKEISNFKYHATLSRENWDGNTGYVHPIYEALCAGGQPAQFMLCGWRPMIDEAKLRLQALGYSPKDIDVEIYG